MAGNWLFDQLNRNAASSSAAFLGSEGDRPLAYADLDRRAAQMANALTELGVEPGDRVAVQVEKSIEAVLLYLGVLRAGGIFLPLNTAYTASEVGYFLTDAKPRVFVCDPAHREGLAESARRAGVARVETLDAGRRGSLAEKFQRASARAQTVSRGPDDLAAILYTSGTTGRSKGAMLTHENLASNATALVEAWRFTSRDTLIHALPIYHTHGLFVAINTLLMAGGAMIFQSKFDPDAVMRAMPRATSLMGVPTFYTRLLQHPDLNRRSAKHMRLFISGSAPLLPETHKAWRERTGHAILERYGMTETNMNTSNPYEGDRIPGAVGRPLPGVELRIADPETGAPMRQGDVGMIEIKGPNVFRGYWNMPEKTVSEFRPDGFFITGDLGQIDQRGYVHIVGRCKDLIITGGLNVYPKEVEDEIDGIPGVVESAVFGSPHPDFGEAVTAAVVKAPGSEIDAAAILNVLESKLAKFKRPKMVLFIAELPRNAMGKVQKNLLRDQYSDIYKTT